MKASLSKLAVDVDTVESSQTNDASKENMHQSIFARMKQWDDCSNQVEQLQTELSFLQEDFNTKFEKYVESAQESMIQVKGKLEQLEKQILKQQNYPKQLADEEKRKLSTQDMEICIPEAVSPAPQNQWTFPYFVQNEVLICMLLKTG